VKPPTGSRSAPPTEDAAAVEPLGPLATEPVQTALQPYEVFRQEREGDPMRHGGSVTAPDPVLALHYARELFGRRQESVRLWVVRRADISVLDDADLLQPPLDRSFKKPGGYVMRDKLAAARAQRRDREDGAAAGGDDR
jgi:ring-1,2-phenylacetyl-CoA epoxidase subunit PaaB